MKLKWNAHVNGNWSAESDVGEYSIEMKSIDEYWIYAKHHDSFVRRILGWSPTIELAMKRCQDLDDYWVKEDE